MTKFWIKQVSMPHRDVVGSTLASLEVSSRLSKYLFMSTKWIRIISHGDWHKDFFSFLVDQSYLSTLYIDICDLSMLTRHLSSCTESSSTHSNTLTARACGRKVTLTVLVRVSDLDLDPEITKSSTVYGSSLVNNNSYELKINCILLF